MKQRSLKRWTTNRHLNGEGVAHKESRRKEIPTHLDEYERP